MIGGRADDDQVGSGLSDASCDVDPESAGHANALEGHPRERRTRVYRMGSKHLVDAVRLRV